MSNDELESLIARHQRRRQLGDALGVAGVVGFFALIVLVRVAYFDWDWRCAVMHCDPRVDVTP